MLVSLKIKKAIEQDIKAQEMYLKTIEIQEKSFNVDLSVEKGRVHDVIKYYQKVLKDAA